MKRILPLSLSLILLLSLSAFAQSAAQSTDKPAAAAADQAASTTAESDEAKTAALAKAAQNPIASPHQRSAPEQHGFGVGQYDRDQNVLNIQPVIPVRIGENWNLINRIILPVIWQPNVQQPAQGWLGFGDMNPTFFFSPAKPHKLIWGVGPAFVDSHCHRRSVGSGKVQHGFQRRRPDHPGSLGHRCTDKQRMVCCRFR